MIVVDSSVWIDNLRNLDVDHTRRLLRLGDGEIIVGDLILLEVLQGARDDAHAAKLQRVFAPFRKAAMLDPELAPVAARNFRRLRAMGVTIRKSSDVVIGTFCIERGYALLQNDRDFLPMVEHLGLQLA